MVDGAAPIYGMMFKGAVPQPPAGSSRRPRAAAPPISFLGLLLPGGVVSVLTSLPSTTAPRVYTDGAGQTVDVVRAYPTETGGRQLLRSFATVGFASTRVIAGVVIRGARTAAFPSCSYLDAVFDQPGLPALSQAADIRGLAVSTMRVYHPASTPCDYLCTRVPVVTSGTCVQPIREDQWYMGRQTHPWSTVGSSSSATAPTAPD